MEGKKVQFGDLGTFYLSTHTTGADSEEEFSLASNMRGIYLRFQPCRMDLNDLTSKSLKKRASLLNVKELAGIETASQGENED